MKFYGYGCIWDVVNNGILCKFQNGVFETDDSRIINTLKDLGYEHEIEIEVKEVKKESKRGRKTGR
jgi:hypothetical protein